MGEEFRDRLRTADERGHRIWVYADLFTGAWRRKRAIVARILIGIYFVLPWLTVGGQPVFRIDIFNRRLFLGGHVFWPHELGSFVPLVLSFGFLIFAATSWAGRFWCGWACPQTVYLEFVYRPIEQWIEGKPRLRKALDMLPAGEPVKLTKKALKWALFTLASFVIANNFVAYFIGPQQLLHEMTQSPANNLFHFGVMAFVTACFVFNFGWFREQMCTITCPYGRLQSVLLDKRSIVVGYDRIRGEPRGKGLGGDCIDCGRCVAVCPTGIDIRDGTQMECVNCTACIDACNFVMEKVNRKPNLVGYTTQEKMEGVQPTKKRLRPWIYSAMCVGLFTFAMIQVHARTSFDVLLLRASAMEFTKVDGRIQNHLRLRVENKMTESTQIKIEAVSADQNLVIPQNGIVLKPLETATLEVFSQLPVSAFDQGVAKRQIKVSDGKSEVKVVDVTLFGVSK